MQVGAALSMVYTSGAPIMFVGCGQTYVDLTRLNTKSVALSAQVGDIAVEVNRACHEGGSHCLAVIGFKPL